MLSYTGVHDSAAMLLRQARAIDLRYHGAGSWQVANDNDDLGAALLKQGELAAADSLIGAALATWRRLLPPGHPSLLWTVGNLAAVRRKQGKNEEAERLLGEVLAGQRRLFPEGHSEMVHTLIDLGDLMRERGQLAAAEALLAPEAVRHRRLLDRISEQAAAVIYNSVVFEQTQEDSLTDPLTSLPNRRYGNALRRLGFSIGPGGDVHQLPGPSLRRIKAVARGLLAP
jgi:tetratricopeptide (TPR) repeat protein